MASVISSSIPPTNAPPLATCRRICKAAMNLGRWSFEPDYCTTRAWSGCEWHDRKGQFTLAADGTLAGSVDAMHSGPGGADLRMFLKYSDETERRKYWRQRSEKMFRSRAEFIPVRSTAQSCQSRGVSLRNHGWSIWPHGRLPSSGSPARRRLRCPALRQQTAHRSIDLGATGRWRDSFDITLPAGYAVDETPILSMSTWSSPAITPASPRKTTASTTSGNTPSVSRHPGRKSRSLSQA